jgi:hypothetical protein
MWQEECEFGESAGQDEGFDNDSECGSESRGLEGRSWGGLVVIVGSMLRSAWTAGSEGITLFLKSFLYA